MTKMKPEHQSKFLRKGTIKGLGAAFLASSSMVVGTFSTMAEEAPTDLNDALDKIVKDGKILFNARLRYSFADFENFSQDANGVTYRLRAGVETGSVFDTKLLVEFDHVRSLNDSFNSTINGNTQFPVVADPDVTELNRFQLQNKSIKDTTLTLGRQRIIHDDARFVGNVGWRQNEQTFDSFRFQNNSVKGLTLDYTYVEQVNRIFGDDSPQGIFESDSHLLNGQYKTKIAGAKATLTGFAYLLDFESDTAPAPADRFSTQTYGGTLRLDKGPFWVQGSFANQQPYRNPSIDYNVNFYKIEGAGKHNGFTLKAGYEVLGGDGNLSFITPLATLHKFNGFADAFLATPADGLADVYGTIDYTKKNVGPFSLLKANFTYHNFSPEEFSGDFGEEFDFVGVVAFKSMKRFKYLLKYANFDAEQFGQDIERLTIQVDLVF